MKRSRLIGHAPEPVVRRKRGMSEDDIALWDSVTESIKPLRKKRPRAVKDDVGTAKIAPTETNTIPSKSNTPAASVRRPENPAAPPPLAPIGRREKSQLGRGRKDIDARLDLHGMTQASAHRALRNFLRRAQDEGATFVLVITGKGRTGTSDSERGVLRRQVPEWLGLAEFRSLVVGYESAYIGHGGEGALYVRVRRGR
jgi:DNA-nicking Smr family endonuclease